MSLPPTMRTFRHLLVLVLLAILLPSCGIPASTSPEPVADRDVPYGLLDAEATTPGSDTSDRPTRTESKVYWLQNDEQITPTASRMQGNQSFPQLNAMLAELAAGPDHADRAAGLSTALGPDVGLTLVEIRASTAIVEVTPSSEVPSADRLPLAVGQIVLTVVSAPGIDKVLLERRGEPIEVPLPGGVLSTEPLTGLDYRQLVH